MIEAFIVCQDFQPPQDFEPSMIEPLLDHSYSLDSNSFEGLHRTIIPFLACGDLSGFDADMSYTVKGGHVSLDPVQRPINPPHASLDFETLSLTQPFVDGDSISWFFFLIFKK